MRLNCSLVSFQRSQIVHERNCPLIEQRKVSGLYCDSVVVIVAVQLCLTGVQWVSTGIDESAAIQVQTTDAHSETFYVLDCGCLVKEAHIGRHYDVGLWIDSGSPLLHPIL